MKRTSSKPKKLIDKLYKLRKEYAEAHGLDNPTHLYLDIDDSVDATTTASSWFPTMRNLKTKDIRLELQKVYGLKITFDSSETKLE